MNKKEITQMRGGKNLLIYYTREVLLIAIGVILMTALKPEITQQGNIYQKLLDN